MTPDIPSRWTFDTGGFMKVRDVLERLGRDGWFRVPSKGGHRQFRHPTKPGKVTVPGHENDTVHPKTLRSVWRQAQLPPV